MRGYVLEEGLRWRVQLTNNRVINRMPPDYNETTYRWMFQDPFYINRVPYRVERYAPICILISKKGKISYTTHRYVCEISPRTRNRPEIIVHRCS